MAGYIFTLNDINSLKYCAEHGVYSTTLSAPENNLWRKHHEATFADYATMQEGDNVYFFIERKIYGIGRLVNIGGACKLCNYPRACEPIPYPFVDKAPMLLSKSDSSENQRWLCTFEHAPHFFMKGVDMDDMLASNPGAFKMLRALWKLSFIKFDDVENQAFKDALIKCNQDSLTNPIPTQNVFEDKSANTHADIEGKVNPNVRGYALEVAPILDSCKDGDAVKHEMAIEAAILFQLTNLEPGAIKTFGKWDYLTHQVVASPFKPVDYMDKIDILGYSYVPNHKPTKSKYLVMEVKRNAASLQDVEQVMKYVDWVMSEYCKNDYSMIQAYLVAYSFEDKLIENSQHIAKRLYTVGTRPIQSKLWHNLRFIKYHFNPNNGLLNFSEF